MGSVVCCHATGEHCHEVTPTFKDAEDRRGPSGPDVMINMRLDSRYDPDDSDVVKQHAMLQAAREGDVAEIISTLEGLDDLASVHCCNQRFAKGATMLMAAAQGGHVLACQVLLSACANVHTEDMDKRRALHFSAYAGSSDVCELLLRAGADPMAIDRMGCDAWARLPDYAVATPADRERWRKLLSGNPDVLHSSSAYAHTSMQDHLATTKGTEQGLPEGACVVFPSSNLATCSQRQGDVSSSRPARC